MCYNVSNLSIKQCNRSKQPLANKTTLLTLKMTNKKLVDFVDFDHFKLNSVNYSAQVYKINKSTLTFISTDYNKIIQEFLLIKLLIN